MDDVHLRNILMECIPITIVEDRVFGKPAVLLDIYHHFEGELDHAYI